MTFDSNSTNKKRQRSDRWSRYVVTGFGGLVLLTLVILITHLISQALPLAYTPSLQHLSSFKTQDNEEIISAGDIINSQPLLVRKSDCRLGLKLLKGDSLESNHDYIRPCEHRLSAHSVMGENYIVDVSPNAQVRVLPVRSFNMGDSTAVDIATSAPQATLSNNITFALPKEKWRERDNWNMALSSKWAVVSISKGNSVFIRWVNRLRPTQVVDKRFYNVDRLVLLPGSESVLLQIEDALYLNRLSDKGASLLPIISGIDASLDENIIFPLAKDRTFFLTNTKTQTLTRWVLSKSEKGLIFKPTYQIALPGEIVRDVAEHASMNLVAVLTDKARVLLVNRVSGDVVASQQIERTAENITWYGNKLYGYSGNTLSVWEGKHLSGITTWASLFEPQHYEGYGAEETVWQTTSASDFQEAKFSLTPLLIGSIKASLLALLIAIPVAIGAAIYTAFFAKSRLRNIIKPAIELLEAIPSVLIGFIAAIWLSPKAEQFLFSFAFFLIVIPFVLIVVALVQRPIAEYLPKKLRHGAELLFAIGGVFFLGFISVEYAPALIFSVMGVDGFTLLASESNSPIGKTTIVVALALGVAISPSIYSLAEDAINGVPNDLKHASFALGATRLQTLLRVVLHVALPGIVAAIMLGFGRAFGETMIVLMVTGNTPISSWGLIEGLRALTANLAIELPEADVSSAHYQILFFTACILFLFTFLVNTIAELLRQHIRSRAYYG
ncbi:ABC transporter permease subunit [Alteromonas sp. Cnat2-8]|uniref:ABC transporter permease subunit n=1 Tax=Alteromonas sp. Cnat2-8 TaxID=2917728 RepID=UPI001EF3FE3C|nr:ABC transporter permease subunit [Alteromonas sp. Cnat2-8]MCG7652292.1 ABC transporter permease subunit [Alteromonas sp. Cnat2-8]